jgi:Ca2+-transporting ATPase
MITAACLGIGHYFMQQGENETVVRTSVFITLLFSNILLTLVNRSFHYSVLTTLRYKNRLVVFIISITLLFIAALLFIPFIRSLFRLEILPAGYLLRCLAIAFLGTMWMEFLKKPEKIKL